MTTKVLDETRRVAERAARDSYGRLLALLSARTRDPAAAEDALAEALREALESWPAAGVPQKPEAWLYTVARRQLAHVARHRDVQERARTTLEILTEEYVAEPGFPDERLKLLFVCAHPAIDENSRTPLMLQLVLGLDANRIARAFLASPSTMSQRLVRAKSKIRDAGISFVVPEQEELPERLASVLDAIYAAFGTGWDDVVGTDAKRRGLSEESIYLGRLVVALVPDAPEARGLLALMLYCEARAAARLSTTGHFVPLEEQEPSLWSRELIIEAEHHLTIAARACVFGRYQTEAAIQSAHCQRGANGQAQHAAINLLYDVLAARAPTAGVLVARAAARAGAAAPGMALAQLAEIPAEITVSYQPYWAVLAHTLCLLERRSEAVAAYDRAIGLTEDPAVREFLILRREAALASSGHVTDPRVSASRR